MLFTNPGAAGFAEVSHKSFLFVSTSTTASFRFARHELRQGFDAASSLFLFNSSQASATADTPGKPQREDWARGEGKDFGPREVPRGPPPTLAAPVRVFACCASCSIHTCSNTEDHAQSHHRLTLSPATPASLAEHTWRNPCARRHAPQARRPARRQHAGRDCRYNHKVPGVFRTKTRHAQEPPGYLTVVCGSSASGDAAVWLFSDSAAAPAALLL